MAAGVAMACCLLAFSGVSAAREGPAWEGSAQEIEGGFGSEADSPLPPESDGPAGAPLAEPADDDESVVTAAGLHAYARARLAEIDRAMPVATTAYRQAVALDPGSVEIARRGYRQAVLAGDRALALTTARTLDAAGQLSRDGSVLLLASALERRRWDEAGGWIDRLEMEGNLAFLAPFMRSWVSLAQGRYAPPEKVPEESLAAFGNRYWAEQRFLLALARGDKTELDDAFAGVRELTDDFGAEQQAITAVRLDGLGRRDLALQLLAHEDAAWTGGDAEAALKRAAKLYRKRKLTPGYGLAMLMNRLAADLRSQGEGVATFSLARMAGFADPASDDVHVTIARAALMAEFPELAYAEAGKVLPASPVWFDAETMQLRALIEQERGAEAVARGERLVQQDRGSARSWRVLGDMRAQQDDFAGAAAAYGQARAAMGGGEDAALMLQLAASLEQAGQWREARPMLERVVELAPDSAVALNHLGYALADRGEDLPRAIALLEKSNRIRPREPAYIDSLGWAYFRAGNYAKALPLIQSAVESEPGNAELNEHLGDVLWAMGRRFEARYAWGAALVGLDDEARQASQIRARLTDKIDGKGADALRP